MKEKLDNVDNENNKNEVVDLFVSHDEDIVGNFVLNLIKNYYDVECTVIWSVIWSHQQDVTLTTPQG